MEKADDNIPVVHLRANSWYRLARDSKTENGLDEVVRAAYATWPSLACRIICNVFMAHRGMGLAAARERSAKLGAPVGKHIYERVAQALLATPKAFPDTADRWLRFRDFEALLQDWDGLDEQVRLVYAKRFVQYWQSAKGVAEMRAATCGYCAVVCKFYRIWSVLTLASLPPSHFLGLRERWAEQCHWCAIAKGSSKTATKVDVFYEFLANYCDLDGDAGALVQELIKFEEQEISKDEVKKKREFAFFLQKQVETATGGKRRSGLLSACLDVAPNYIAELLLGFDAHLNSLDPHPVLSAKMIFGPSSGPSTTASTSQIALQPCRALALLRAVDTCITKRRQDEKLQEEVSRLPEQTALSHVLKGAVGILQNYRATNASREGMSIIMRLLFTLPANLRRTKSAPLPAESLAQAVDSLYRQAPRANSSGKNHRNESAVCENLSNVRGQPVPLYPLYLELYLDSISKEQQDERKKEQAVYEARKVAGQDPTSTLPGNMANIYSSTCACFQEFADTVEKLPANCPLPSKLEMQLCRFVRDAMARPIMQTQLFEVLLKVLTSLCEHLHFRGGLLEELWNQMVNVVKDQAFFFKSCGILLCHGTSTSENNVRSEREIAAVINFRTSIVFDSVAEWLKSRRFASYFPAKSFASHLAFSDEEALSVGLFLLDPAKFTGRYGIERALIARRHACQVYSLARDDPPALAVGRDWLSKYSSMDHIRAPIISTDTVGRVLNLALDPDPPVLFASALDGDVNRRLEHEKTTQGWLKIEEWISTVEWRHFANERVIERFVVILGKQWSQRASLLKHCTLFVNKILCLCFHLRALAVYKSDGAVEMILEKSSTAALVPVYLDAEDAAKQSERYLAQIVRFSMTCPHFGSRKGERFTWLVNEVCADLMSKFLQNVQKQNASSANKTHADQVLLSVFEPLLRAHCRRVEDVALALSTLNISKVNHAGVRELFWELLPVSAGDDLEQAGGIAGTRGVPQNSSETSFHMVPSEALSTASPSVVRVPRKVLDQIHVLASLPFEIPDSEQAVIDDDEDDNEVLTLCEEEKRLAESQYYTCNELSKVGALNCLYQRFGERGENLMLQFLKGGAAMPSDLENLLSTSAPATTSPGFADLCRDLIARYWKVPDRVFEVCSSVVKQILAEPHSTTKSVGVDKNNNGVVDPGVGTTPAEIRALVRFTTARRIPFLDSKYAHRIFSMLEDLEQACARQQVADVVLDEDDVVDAAKINVVEKTDALQALRAANDAQVEELLRFILHKKLQFPSDKMKSSQPVLSDGGLFSSASSFPLGRRWWRCLPLAQLSEQDLVSILNAGIAVHPAHLAAKLTTYPDGTRVPCFQELAESVQHQILEPWFPPLISSAQALAPSTPETANKMVPSNLMVLQPKERCPFLLAESIPRLSGSILEPLRRFFDAINPAVKEGNLLVSGGPYSSSFFANFLETSGSGVNPAERRLSGWNEVVNKLLAGLRIRARDHENFLHSDEQRLVFENCLSRPGVTVSSTNAASLAQLLESKMVDPQHISGVVNFLLRLGGEGGQAVGPSTGTTTASASSCPTVVRDAALRSMLRLSPADRSRQITEILNTDRTLPFQVLFTICVTEIESSHVPALQKQLGRITEAKFEDLLDLICDANPAILISSSSSSLSKDGGVHTFPKQCLANMFWKPFLRRYLQGEPESASLNLTTKFRRDLRWFFLFKKCVPESELPAILHEMFTRQIHLVDQKCLDALTDKCTLDTLGSAHFKNLVGHIVAAWAKTTDMTHVKNWILPLIWRQTASCCDALRRKMRCQEKTNSCCTCTNVKTGGYDLTRGLVFFDILVCALRDVMLTAKKADIGESAALRRYCEAVVREVVVFRASSVFHVGTCVLPSIPEKQSFLELAEFRKSVFDFMQLNFLNDAGLWMHLFQHDWKLCTPSREIRLAALRAALPAYAIADENDQELYEGKKKRRLTAAEFGLLASVDHCARKIVFEVDRDTVCNQCMDVLINILDGEPEFGATLSEQEFKDFVAFAMKKKQQAVLVGRVVAATLRELHKLELVVAQPQKDEATTASRSASPPVLSIATLVHVALDLLDEAQSTSNVTGDAHYVELLEDCYRSVACPFQRRGLRIRSLVSAAVWKKHQARLQKLVDEEAVAVVSSTSNATSAAKKSSPRDNNNKAAGSCTTGTQEERILDFEFWANANLDPDSYLTSVGHLTEVRREKVRLHNEAAKKIEKRETAK